LTNFGTATHFDPLEQSDCYKFEILKIQDGVERHVEKNRDISATVWPISAKFDTVTQFDPTDPSDFQTFEIFKIQDGGAAILEKLKNCHISALVGPIAKKFCMMMHFERR